MTRHTPNRWTPDEDAYLIDHYPHEGAACVAGLKRHTLTSVASRAQVLEVKRLPRRLVTCEHCGAEFRLRPGARMGMYCKDRCRAAAKRLRQRGYATKGPMPARRVTDAMIEARAKEIAAQATPGWRDQYPGDCFETTPPAVATGTRRE